MEKFTLSALIAQLKAARDDGYCEVYDDVIDASEMSDIRKRAKARGIELKDNGDLAGIKYVYAKIDRPNLNNDKVTLDLCKKKLSTLIGKPLDIDHNRRYVIGAIIDAEVIDDNVIVYAVIYKSNFAEEWDTAKKLFKENKLATSLEMYCPRQYQKIDPTDGSTVLTPEETRFMGGAILFKSDPAEPEAKVLTLARKNSEVQIEDMIYASMVSENSVITADTIIDVTTKEEKEITCQNCHEKIKTIISKEPGSTVTCPQCQSVINRDGAVVYPPQVIDFSLSCLNASCRARNWLVEARQENSAIVRCMTCKTKHEVNFADIKESEVEQHLISTVEIAMACPQCNKTVARTILSTNKKPEITCHNCGLKFPVALAFRAGKKKIEQVCLVPEKPKRKDNDDKFFAAVGLTSTGKKKRKYPIADEVQVRAALQRIDQEDAGVTLEKIGIKVEDVKINIFKRAIELGMTDIIKACADKIQQLGIQLSRSEGVRVMGKKLKEMVRRRFASLKGKVDTLTAALSTKEAEVTTLQAAVQEKDLKLAEVQRVTDEKIALYKANAKLIVARQNELGDRAKDMTDEDLLDETKYKVASLEVKLASVTNVQPGVIQGSKKPDPENVNLSAMLAEVRQGLAGK